MKFAHMADCHIGGWRDPKLRDLSMEAFDKAIDICITEKVDFVLISGDLFHTSLPSIDCLKSAVKKLKQLKDLKIRVYIIPGSHDFSPSGKTMIDVFSEAGLMVNVFRGKVIDKKLNLEFTKDSTGAKITGIIGKRGMLERSFYTSLNREVLEKEEGFKIFMLHTAITELKPRDMEKMDSLELSFLPKGFDYYAGGHVHYVHEHKDEKYNHIIYPGPLFPNNFRELEKLGAGGFYIYDDGKVNFKEVKVIDTHPVNLECSQLDPREVEALLKKEIEGKDFSNTIVMLRMFGNLSNGRPSDIDLREIFREIYAKGAFFIMKNMNKLSSQEFDDIKSEKRSIADIESSIIDAALDDKEAVRRTKDMMKALHSEKDEGEKVYDFEKRVVEDAMKILDL